MATRGRGRGRGLQRRCEFCRSSCRPGGASVSGVLVGGEGGGRRQRQWAGLRADAPYRWGVPGRLGDAEGVAAAAVGGVCHPGNKQFLGRPVRVHPSFPLQGRHRRRPSHGGGGGADRGSVGHQHKRQSTDSQNRPEFYSVGQNLNLRVGLGDEFGVTPPSRDGNHVEEWSCH